MDYESAVARALASLEASDVETSWSDALVSSQGDTRPFIFTTQDGMLIEQRQHVVDAPPAIVYAGCWPRRPQGWLAWNQLWRLRAQPTGSSAAWDFAGGGATRSISVSGRRRFLARGSGRSGPLGAPAGGDESAWPGLAPVSGRDAGSEADG